MATTTTRRRCPKCKGRFVAEPQRVHRGHLCPACRVPRCPKCNHPKLTAGACFGCLTTEMGEERKRARLTKQAQPTAALPGTEEKVAELERRAALGLELFHPEDARGTR